MDPAPGTRPDELLAGFGRERPEPERRPGAARARVGRRLSRTGGRPGMWAALALLVTLVVQPDLLSSEADRGPERPTNPATAEAPVWTGGPHRPTGNTFFDTPTRRLRLPAL